MSRLEIDKSLQELDPVKMLLFFLVFLAISFLIIFVLIVPNMKEYKSVKALYSRNEMATMRIKNNLNAKESELQKIAQNNQKLLDALIIKFNEQKFTQYANKFFQNVTLKKSTQQATHKGFLVYELNVSSSIQSPQNFYDFLNGLASYESVIKADFPIKMVADSNIIQSNFNIKVYNLSGTQKNTK